MRTVPFLCQQAHPDAPNSRFTQRAMKTEAAAAI